MLTLTDNQIIGLVCGIVAGLILTFITILLIVMAMYFYRKGRVACKIDKLEENIEKKEVVEQAKNDVVVSEKSADNEKSPEFIVEVGDDEVKKENLVHVDSRTLDGIISDKDTAKDRLYKASTIMKMYRKSMGSITDEKKNTEAVKDLSIRRYELVKGKMLDSFTIDDIRNFLNMVLSASRVMIHASAAHKNEYYLQLLSLRLDKLPSDGNNKSLCSIIEENPIRVPSSRNRFGILSRKSGYDKNNDLWSLASIADDPTIGALRGVFSTLAKNAEYFLKEFKDVNSLLDHELKSFCMNFSDNYIEALCRCAFRREINFLKKDSNSWLCKMLEEEELKSFDESAKKDDTINNRIEKISDSNIKEIVKCCSAIFEASVGSTAKDQFDGLRKFVNEIGNLVADCTKYDSYIERAEGDIGTIMSLCKACETHVKVKYVSEGPSINEENGI